MNDRETLDLQLNVLRDFEPGPARELSPLPKFLFLANGSPVHQMKTLDQCPEASLVVADTMDHYIRTEPDELRQLLKRIDGLVLNDSEAKLLTGDDNLVRAGKAICGDGPAVRRHQEGRARGDVLRPRRNLRRCRPIPRPRWSIPPAPATASPAE